MYRVLLLTFALFSPFQNAAEKVWFEPMFYFELNQFKGPSYSVTVLKDKMLVQEFLGGYGINSNWCSVSINEKTLDNVYETLNEFDFKNTDEQIYKKGMRDGTGYKIILQHPKLAKSVSGANQYPENFNEIQKYVHMLIKLNNCELTL